MTVLKQVIWKFAVLVKEPMEQTYMDRQIKTTVAKYVNLYII